MNLRRQISAFLLLHPELDTKQTAIAQLSVATPPEVNKNYRYGRYRLGDVLLWRHVHMRESHPNHEASVGVRTVGQADSSEN